MSRLVAFGCSLTYGYGLEDCYLEKSNTHSKLAWPDILSSKFSIPSINRGVNAASNKKILLQAIDTPFEKDDIAVILWTYTYRGLLFSNDGSEINILPSAHIHPIIKPYYTVHSNYDLIIQSILDIHYTNIFLSTKNVKVYNFFVDTELGKKERYESLKLLDDIDLVWVNLRKLTVDIATDKSHPGPLSQQEIAKFIAETIEKDNRNSLF